MVQTPLVPGTVLDDFTLIERIAVGGMGAIWTASHPDWPKPLVLKTPFLGRGADVSTIVGYEAEEMIMRRLEGPHVPKFIAAGDLRTRPYIVMELVEGEVLEKKLEGPPLAINDAVRIATRIAAALESLHRQGVIHLDLKPANVILTPRGAVLIDFGLAHHEALPDLLREESDVPMGSPATIAPEQLVGDRSRPESDIYALGAILYRMVTGEFPFGEPVSVAGQKRRLFRPPVAPRVIDPKIPRWLQEVILRCLDVDATQRYRTAGQLLFDLNHPDQVKLTDRGVTAKPAGLVTRLTAWLRGRSVRDRAPSRVAPSRQVATQPVVVAAIDLAQGADQLAQEVRQHVIRVLATEDGAKLACVTVLKSKLVGDNPDEESTGRTSYVARLVALKDWARTLDLADDRVSFHVLTAFDPASAILDYAHLNRVDHIVMGARSAGGLRRHLGSVSSAVVAGAHCTVTVVRLKEISDDEPGIPA